MASHYEKAIESLVSAVGLIESKLGIATDAVQAHLDSTAPAVTATAAPEATGKAT